MVDPISDAKRVTAEKIEDWLCNQLHKTLVPSMGLQKPISLILFHQWSDNIIGEIPLKIAYDSVIQALEIDFNAVAIEPLSLPFKWSSCPLAEDVQDYIAALTNSQSKLKAMLNNLADPLESSGQDKIPIFLLGVCDIPFALLLAYLVGPGRQIWLMEYRGQDKKYAWRAPSAPTDSVENDDSNLLTPRLNKALSNLSNAHQATTAILAVSISALIQESDYCTVIEKHATSSLAEIPIFHLYLDKPRRGVIDTPAMLGDYLLGIEEVLQDIFTRCPQIQNLYLFLAAPMTIIYGFGQLLTNHTLKYDTSFSIRCYSYQVPSFRWGVEIIPSLELFHTSFYNFLPSPFDSSAIDSDSL